ncbi:hypothetical protein HPB51_018133 [Rhipicephalus microplus]|uniref:Uncharacterized protein n=1 Tax=Rhipicephalus microplus TaxID=6941 RepID=A0A9J6E3M3_RHIMP|nr:hypothetical protein HPB51_018133 [Rhipicephalus microplus]
MSLLERRASHCPSVGGEQRRSAGGGSSGQPQRMWFNEATLPHRQQRGSMAPGCMYENTRGHGKLEKLRIVEERIGQVQAKLEESKRASERAENEADDSLEAFMNALKSRSLEDKTQRSRWRQELAGLLQERLRLTRVANIAKPAHLPPLTGALLKPLAKGEAQGSKKVLPMTGSLKNRKKLVMPEPERRVVACSSSQDGEEEEEEDEEQEGNEDGAKASAAARNDVESSSHSTDVVMDETSDDNERRQSQTTDEHDEKDVAKFKDKAPSEDKMEEVEKKPVIIGQSGDGKTHLNAKYGY